MKSIPELTPAVIPQVFGTPSLTATDVAALGQLTGERLLIPAEQAGLSVAPLGISVLPAEGIQIQAPNGNYWCFDDHRVDPTRDEYGGRVPVPAEISQRLHDLVDAGAHVDLVWTGHEMPASWKPGDRVPELVPAPVDLREMDRRIVTANINAARSIAGSVALGAKTVGKVAASSALAAGSLLDGLDPVILGGVIDPETNLVCWCLLAQWVWE